MHKAGGGPRVLYVEDEPDIQRIARLALESVGGLSVAICGSGAEALDTAVAFAPDIVLLDVVMPDMDGPATLQALARLPALGHVPVVFMTANVLPTQLAEYRAMGAVAVLEKPFDPMQLAARVVEIWQQNGGAAGPLKRAPAA